jgi:hypothetical protein
MTVVSDKGHPALPNGTTGSPGETSMRLPFYVILRDQGPTSSMTGFCGGTSCFTLGWSGRNKLGVAIPSQLSASTSYSTYSHVFPYSTNATPYVGLRDQGHRYNYFLLPVFFYVTVKDSLYEFHSQALEHNF